MSMSMIRVDIKTIVATLTAHDPYGVSESREYLRRTLNGLLVIYGNGISSKTAVAYLDARNDGETIRNAIRTAFGSSVIPQVVELEKDQPAVILFKGYAQGNAESMKDAIRDANRMAHILHDEHFDFNVLLAADSTVSFTVAVVSNKPMTQDRLEQGVRFMLANWANNVLTQAIP